MIDYVKDIFLFSEKSPLIFTRMYFWVFFAIVLLIYSIVYKNRGVRNAYLFFASLFFYYKTSGFFFLLLIFSTIVDFFIGQQIYKSPTKTRKKIFVALSVLINLGVLAYFKYAYFFVDTFNSAFNTHFEAVNYLALWSNNLTGTHFDVSKILLPVGISFFTFQTISYSVDVYREKLKPVTNILDFGFYVSFFPQLVAGPIVRASDFIPQLYKEYSLNRYEFGYALFMILNGLIKKMVISDYIAVNFVDRVFTNPLSFTGFENMMAAFGYSLQVYCDFSGYTDIAIGVALLMGFQLPVNFNSPYKAQNVGEFWKRWHISLSSWLKDYLYIPLGGNRSGSIQSYLAMFGIIVFVAFISGWFALIYVFILVLAITLVLMYFFPSIKRGVDTNVNIMITMLLGGLWHGASWNFVIWGGLNGLGILVYKYWKRISPYEKSTLYVVRAWKIFITFSFITFTRFFFRGESPEIVGQMWHQIFNNFSWDLIFSIIGNYNMVFILWTAGMVIHWLPSTFKTKYREWFIYSPAYVKIIVSIVTVFVIYQTISSELQPFIYFQF